MRYSEICLAPKLSKATNHGYQRDQVVVLPAFRPMA